MMKKSFKERSTSRDSMKQIAGKRSASKKVMSSEKKKMRKNIRHVQYSLANKQEDRRASGNEFPKYRQTTSSKNNSPPKLTKAPIFMKDN